MMNLDGTCICDRDGWDVKNGAITECVIVSDIDEETGLIVNMHFCRDVKDEDGKVTHKGCANKVLSKSNIAHRLSLKKKE
jgi:hypothetical protein